MRILLSEDDEGLRGFVSRALELDGHDVAPTCDGMEALEALDARGGEFDLLFSDIRMPLMDGITLARSSADRWPQLPVLLMTGYADETRTHVEAMPETISGILTKPFSLIDMREAIASACDQGEPVDEIPEVTDSASALAPELEGFSAASIRRAMQLAYSLFKSRSR